MSGSAATQAQLSQAYNTNTRQRKKDVPKTWLLRDQISLFERFAPNLTGEVNDDSNPASSINFAKTINLLQQDRPFTSDGNSNQASVRKV
jgi:hypothetical protein